MVAEGAAAATASALPRALRDAEDVALRFRAFEILHAEAVASGELPAAPPEFPRSLSGRLLGALLLVLLGSTIGALSVAAVLFLLHIAGRFFS